MMAAGLGDSVEGEIRDIVESRLTNSKTPFLCILDEYGYYAVEVCCGASASTIARIFCYFCRSRFARVSKSVEGRGCLLVLIPILKFA